MTDAERDELIEKSLLQELDATDEARVQQLRREDEGFRQEYDFQETLIRQVRLKRRQELLSMFAEFEAEQAPETDQADTTPVVRLSPGTDHETAPADPTIIPLWEQRGFRVAASIALAFLLGAVVWWQLTQYDARPVADHRDSTSVRPSTDTVPKKPVGPPVVPAPQPQGPVAQNPGKPARLQGPTSLPYYETDDVRLGFGNGQKTSESRTVVFNTGPEPAYEFQDTLRVYLPTLPPAKPAWSLVYSRAADTYYLVTGSTRYEVVKGLQGKQPLVRVK